MAPALIVNLDTSSDARFRDIVGRDQYQVATTGNLARKTHYQLSGNVANVAVMEAVSTDATNAQFDFLVSASGAPLVLSNITTANMNAWSANNSVLTLRQDTTTLRSANVVVDKLNATTVAGNLLKFTLPAGDQIQLKNCVIRSFQKSLPSSGGYALGICSILYPYAYTAELHVVQSQSGASVAKSYKFNIHGGVPSLAWRRLIPLSSTSTADTEWGVEIRHSTSLYTTNMRLVRVIGSVTAGVECTVIVYQSRADPVTISAYTATATLINHAATPVYENSLSTQVRGNMGIGTDMPTDILTVAGVASVDSLQSANSIIVGTGVGARNPIVDATPLAQGAYMAWNYLSDGCTNFICKRGSGSGGFNFYRSDFHGTLFSDGKRRLANITSSGIIMSQGGFAAPGSIVGSLFVSGTDSTINEGVTVSPNNITRAVNGSGWVTIATFSYAAKSDASRLSIYFDIAYDLYGSGIDNFKSHITVDDVEVSFKQQQFQNAGGTYGKGTRSNVLFPISAVVSNGARSTRTIRIEVKLDQADDNLILITPTWMLKVLERKT